MNEHDNKMHADRRWRQLARSDEVPAGRIVDVADGQDQVLWRSEAGTVVLCEARCPHLFSHFGVDGYVDGENLICAAHGWRFATDGTATDRNGECARPVRTWTVHDDGTSIRTRASTD